MSLCLMAGTTSMSQAQLIINEFMQSNIDCIMDDLNDYPDSWVELYNPSETSINLNSFSIGIKEKAGKAFKLPSAEVAPNAHVLIYCDKVGKGFHTDFRLESGKDGAIYLFKNGEVVDCLTGIKKMPAPNIAYGRINDGADEWDYQLIPTPGTTNMGGVASTILADPIFNVCGGVMKNPVEVNITLPKGTPEGSVIRYTTDCSEPTLDSPIFSQPIQINTTTIIRAKLFCEGFLSPRATTQSYIYHHADTTLPIVSIVTDRDNLYDENIGILSDGPLDAPMENWLYEWRRPINIEYFTSSNMPAEINQLCETRLKGSKSRYYSVKSMVVYANKRFGTKRLEHEFFPLQRPGVTDFKSLELRNAGQDFQRMYMRDALVQRTMGDYVDIDWQAYQPVVVYLNGTYHALLNLRERANEDNIYTHFNGLEDIDMIENLKEVKAGSIDNFNKFKQFYSEEGHTYQEYCNWMDMDEFINFFIMQVYFGNCDFPGNNNIMWRPIAEDGKWRWLCKDLDLTLGFATKYDFAYFDWLYHPEDYPTMNWATNEETTRMFRALLELSEFVDAFTTRFSIYMGDFMNENRIVDMLNEMAASIEKEYQFNDKKNINNEYPLEHYVELTRMNILPRNQFLYSYLSEYFNLGKAIPVTIECTDRIAKSITLNNIMLSETAFNGALFAGKNLKIEVIPEDNVDDLVIEVYFKDSEENTLRQVLSSQDCNITIPDSGEIYINVTSQNNSVEAIGVSSDIDFSSEYDILSLAGFKLNYRSIKDAPNGIYIIKQGHKILKYLKSK